MVPSAEKKNCGSCPFFNIFVNDGSEYDGEIFHGTDTYFKEEGPGYCGHMNILDKEDGYLNDPSMSVGNADNEETKRRIEARVNDHGCKNPDIFKQKYGIDIG
ncbi:hypothetical protein GF389_02450 [Candidatus Dojkabacteria bacterium]|nr:hypothetical protein [Candidatus Dojkabacteria bacterium]